MREREGLFAECVVPVTKEQIQEAARRHRERFQQTLAALQKRGEEYRERVRPLVRPEDFSEWERRFSRTPGTPEYLADFFWQELKWRRSGMLKAISARRRREFSPVAGECAR